MTHKLLEEIRRDFKKDGELLTSVNGLYARVVAEKPEIQNIRLIVCLWGSVV